VCVHVGFSKSATRSSLSTRGNVGDPHSIATQVGCYVTATTAPANSPSYVAGPHTFIVLELQYAQNMIDFMSLITSRWTTRSVIGGRWSVFVDQSGIKADIRCWASICQDGVNLSRYCEPRPKPGHQLNKGGYSLAGCKTERL
jgi:hypothetical protein